MSAPVSIQFADIPRPPSWAGGYGADRFGIHADLVFGNVTQRFRWIPPGTFQMGSPEGEEGRSSNETQHWVTIRRGYWLAQTPCTQAQWQTVMDSNPSRHKGESLPVEQVSWEDCQQFCRELASRVPALDLRLPTEAEWEYVCRAGATGEIHDVLEKEGKRRTPELEEIAWYKENSGDETHPVGEKLPNAWGLHDMHGNVWEWCADWYGDYRPEAQTDPMGPEDGGSRVLRGGSFWSGARDCRSACRGGFEPGGRGGLQGFRLVAGQPPDGGVFARGATGPAEEGADAPGSRDATSEAGPARGASRRKSRP